MTCRIHELLALCPQVSKSFRYSEPYRDVQVYDVVSFGSWNRLQLFYLGVKILHALAIEQDSKTIATLGSEIISPTDDLLHRRPQ